MIKDRFEKDFKDVFCNPVKKLKDRKPRQHYRESPEREETVTGRTFPGSKFPHGNEHG